MELGALFDWDGVVIDSSAHHERSWEQLAAEIDKPLPSDHFVRGFGMKNQVIIPEILGWAFDAEEIETLSLRKEQLYRDIIRVDGIEALHGVAALLRMLKEHGVPCAVASSTHRRNVEVVLDEIGLRPYFEAFVTAEDVAHGKPDPEVFLKGAERIDREAACCVVFEDAHVGIEAGLAAGARVVAVATTHDIEELGNANLAVASLAEIDWARFTGIFD